MNIKHKPDPSPYRAVWTAKDEAALTELVERKQRVMTHARGNLAAVLRTCAPIADDEIDNFIDSAEVLLDALGPFVRSKED
jgi:hypothetical protein